MNRIIFLLASLISLTCCNIEVSDDEKESQQALNNNDSLIKPEKDNKKPKQPDSLFVDYWENIEILNILKEIPDTSFLNWKWSKKEREEKVGFILNYHFKTDTTNHFPTFQYVYSNTIKIGVIDGTWTMSIYKIKIILLLLQTTLQEIAKDYLFLNIMR